MKVGDKLLVYGRFCYVRLLSIVRETKPQCILENQQRFRKTILGLVGSNAYKYHYLGEATPEEIKKFEYKKNKRT